MRTDLDRGRSQPGQEVTREAGRATFPLSPCPAGCPLWSQGPIPVSLATEAVYSQPQRLSVFAPESAKPAFLRKHGTAMHGPTAPRNRPTCIIASGALSGSGKSRACFLAFPPQYLLTEARPPGWHARAGGGCDRSHDVSTHLCIWT